MTLATYIKYAAAIGFIIFGLIIRYSKNPRWETSRKLAWVLIICGAVTLLLRIYDDFLS